MVSTTSTTSTVYSIRNDNCLLHYWIDYQSHHTCFDIVNRLLSHALQHYGLNWMHYYDEGTWYMLTECFLNYNIYWLTKECKHPYMFIRLSIFLGYICSVYLIKKLHWTTYRFNSVWITIDFLSTKWYAYASLWWVGWYFLAVFHSTLNRPNVKKLSLSVDAANSSLRLMVFQTLLIGKGDVDKWRKPFQYAFRHYLAET